MNIEHLQTVLTDELDASVDDNKYALPHGTRITVFLQAEGTVLPVHKVDNVVFRDDYLVLEADEGRVFSDAGAIVAVRADQEATARRDSRVGFG